MSNEPKQIWFPNSSTSRDNGAAATLKESALSSDCREMGRKIYSTKKN